AKQPLSDYEIARKRVKKKKEFYGNFISWSVFSVFLLIFNLIVSPEFLWAFFGIVGWGIGVLFHGLDAFGYLGKHTRWEEKAIHKEMERMARRRNQHPRELPPADRVMNDELELRTLRKDKNYDESDLV
ncbi:MAG: 2TM domain-containing protein, partial [Bacteroidota bacterium]